MNAVKNDGALLFSGFGVGTFVYFASKSAIDNGDSGTAIASKKLGGADRKYGAIELSERSLNLVTGSIEDFVSSDDIADLLVVVFLDDFKGVIVEKFIGAFVGKFEDGSGLFVVEFDANFGRINLDIETFENFGGSFAGVNNLFKECCVVGIHLIYSFR